MTFGLAVVLLLVVVCFVAVVVVGDIIKVVAQVISFPSFLSCLEEKLVP